MAASIAKLAIQISTDTREMSDGLRNAQKQLAGVADSIKSTERSLASIAAGKALEKLAGKLFQIAGTLRREMTSAALDFQDRLAKINEMPALDTLRGQLDRLHDTLGLALVGAADKATAGLKRLLEVADQINISLGREAFSAILNDLDAAQSRSDSLDKKLAEMNRKIQRDIEETRRKQEQALESQRAKAQSLTESLRTPLEKLQAGLAELRSLPISDETFSRGAKRLADEFERASRAAKEIKNIRPNVGALERGTTAEFSGRLQAQFSSEQQAKALRELKTEQQRTNGILKSILDAVDKPPVELKKGKF